jgi:dTDP-glucose pyrophosphorylase
LISNWKDVLVSTRTPLQEAIAKVDASSLQVALVVNDDGTLAGVVTDGDVRRVILRGRGLDVPVSEAMNSQPTTVPRSMPRLEMLALMRRRLFHHLPLVDESNKLVGLATLDELIGNSDQPNWVVLMAGGLGTRLQSLTQDRPKPLLTVGGKPILETIVESFVEQGFRNIFLSVNYKAEMVREHFEDGGRWGANVRYLQETTRLGTAGALSLLPELPAEPIVVMNGDLLTRTNFQSLLQFHRDHNATATMAVREYDFQVPFGVVRMAGEQIEAIEEKPVRRSFVNAGIYVLSPHALERVPHNAYFDMPTLFERLIAERQSVTAYPLREYWLDIGRMEEYERAQKEWGKESSE